MLSVCEPWLDTGGSVRPLLVAIDANWIALLCVLLGPATSAGWTPVLRALKVISRPLLPLRRVTPGWGCEPRLSASVFSSAATRTSAGAASKTAAQATRTGNRYDGPSIDANSTT